MQKIKIFEKFPLLSKREEIEEIKYRLTGRVILFISSVEGEGKTSVALALGRLLAESRKVLYIGPPLKKFDMKEEKGDQIYCSDVDNFYVLLKESITVEDVEKNRTEFDYILVEAKALQISKESLPLVSVCDQNILVSEANRTSYRTIKENIDLLHAVHGKEINFVLNRAKKNYELLKRKNRQR